MQLQHRRTVVVILDDHSATLQSTCALYAWIDNKSSNGVPMTDKEELVFICGHLWTMVDRWVLSRAQWGGADHTADT